MADRGRADPTRIVADADVLAADLLVGGEAREALDRIREHSWLTLVASDPLLDDAEAVIADLATPSLASDWRERVAALREPVEHPEGDHPGLASAHHGDAAHVLTLDPDLTGAEAAVGLQGRTSVSLRTPDAFLTVFDPAALYETEVATGGAGDVDGARDGNGDQDGYPGPDRDPRE